MKFCIFLGNNFEDVEALTVIDLLRRAKVTVDIFGVGDNRIMSRSSVIYITDHIFKSIQNLRVREYDGILLPGGPAVEELAKNDELINIIKFFFNLKKLVFAICAAPKLLDKAGVLAGKKYTCFPGTDIKNGTYVDEKVVVDGNVITSQGVGTSLDAAIKLIEIIVSKEEAENQAKRVLFQPK
jgi:protein deglycase